MSEFVSIGEVLHRIGLGPDVALTKERVRMAAKALAAVSDNLHTQAEELRLQRIAEDKAAEERSRARDVGICECGAVCPERERGQGRQPEYCSTRCRRNASNRRRRLGLAMIQGLAK